MIRVLSEAAKAAVQKAIEARQAIRIFLGLTFILFMAFLISVTMPVHPDTAKHARPKQ